MDEGVVARIEQLEEWIGEVEDKAWAAARDAATSRFLLGNLVLELGRSGVIDAERFIRNLLTAAPRHPDYPKEIQEFLEELLRCLPIPEEGGGDGEPGAPRVFH